MDLNVEIRVKAEERYAVEERVFGHFIEHLGLCIREGIWDERAEAADCEFGSVRRDVFEAMAALRPPVLRWPGGCFSDTYHWRDGVGPPAKRPRRVNRAWWWLRPQKTAFENNRFGTDEFLDLCRRLNAEPYLNINFGATPREAAEWVEYCNGAPGTPGGDLRADNGRPEPYGVKLWGIGNETWGAYEAGFCARGKLYARRYLPFLRAMKQVDPGIQPVAVGANNVYPKWNKEFLEAAGRNADYLSLHEYTPGVNPLHRAAFLGLAETKYDYYSAVAGADLMRDSILGMRRDIEAVLGPDATLKIAFDEWNAWWTNSQIVRAEDYTLREGLLTACVLSHLVKLSPVLGMANFAQLVNVLGLIITHREGLYVTPSYHAFKMYRDGVFDQGVRADVQCDTVHTRKMSRTPAMAAMPLAEVVASRREQDGALSLLVVNKHFEEPLSADIGFKDFTAGALDVRLLYANSPFIKNSMDDPEAVAVTERDVACAPDGCHITLPPHSVSHCLFHPAQ